MVQVLSEYIKSIALFLIFMSFIAIIMPNGKYKDYINLCLGFILIFILLQPLNGLISKLSDPNALSGINLQLENNYSNTIQASTSTNAGNAQTEQIIREYKKALDEQLKTLVDKQAYITGYIYSSSEFTINSDENDNNFGTILSITLYVNESGENTENENKPFIRIEKVYIDPIPFIPNQSTNTENIEETESSQIISLKNSISDFYNVPSGNIYVKVQERLSR